jgi:hypothetical protein
MIKIVKKVPSDTVVARMFTVWYKTMRPKWKLPLDICIGTFFVAMTIYSFLQTPLPFFTWIALGGAIVSFVAAFAYVPYLVNMTVKANKRQPSYNVEKIYQFYPDHLDYSYEGVPVSHIPLNKFSRVLVKEGFYLFLYKDKLVLWLSDADLSKEESDKILDYFRQLDVPIE